MRLSYRIVGQTKCKTNVNAKATTKKLREIKFCNKHNIKIRIHKPWVELKQCNISVKSVINKNKA